MFRRAPLVSEDMADWIAENYDWAAPSLPHPAPLILPTKDFFKAGRGEDHATAMAVTEDIKRHLHISRRIELEAILDVPEEFQHNYQATSAAAGTYHYDEETPLIRYAPRLLRRPVSFINVMAHELMHDKLAGREHLLPGGIEAHELATDLHCIIWGFGVFQLEDAEQSGWSGYMTQNSRAWALAEFLARNGHQADEALSYLSPRPKRLLKRAIAEFAAA